MEVTFHRLPKKRYFTTAVRDDGVTVFVPGYDRARPTPHDLAHFIAEREFGLTRGFWGSVAAGAMFVNMSVVSGRRRPHAAERSKQIIKAHEDDIGAAEAVAGALHIAVERDTGPEEAHRWLSEMWSVASAEPLPLTVAEIEQAIESLREATARWAEVPKNEGMTLRWGLPVVQPQPVRGRRARSAHAGRGGSRSRGSR